MAKISVTLPESLQEFVEREVKEGGYRTASEYLRTLLHERYKEHVQERFEAFIAEGLQSGPAVQATPEFWDDLTRKCITRYEERAKPQ